MGTGGVPLEWSVLDILEAFKKCNGKVSKTAEMLNCSIAVLYLRMQQHPELKEAVDDARKSYDHKILDKAEENIENLLEKADTSSTFYALNMRGHDRGWIHPSIRASQLQDGVEKIQQMLDELLKLQRQNFVLQEEALTYRNALLAAGVPLPAIADKSQSNDLVPA